MPELDTIDYIISFILKYPVASVVLSFFAGWFGMYAAFFKGYVSTQNITQRMARLEAENEKYSSDIEGMKFALQEFRERDKQNWAEDRARLRELESKLSELINRR